MKKLFYVYIMSNRKRSHVLYTGVTGNLPRRAFEHKKHSSRASLLATTSHASFTTRLSRFPV